MRDDANSKSQRRKRIELFLVLSNLPENGSTTCRNLKKVSSTCFFIVKYNTFKCD